MAGDRAKRQRAPSMSKLRAADEQIAALSKQLHAVKLQQESLQLRNRLLEREMESRADSPSYTIISQMVDDNTRRLIEGEILGDGNFSLCALGEASELSRQQMVSMTFDEFRKLYGRYVQALAEVLLRCRAEDKSSPTAKRMEALVSEVSRLLFGFVSTRTSLDDIRSFLKGSASASTDILLQTIGLSPRQKCALLMLRRVFACNLGAMVSERRRVSANLQAAKVGLSGIHHHFSHTDTVKLINRLQQLLKQEHGQVVIANLAFWQRVMTPFQQASLMVQVHPAINCDAFDMIEELAKDAGEPEFFALLAEATSLRNAQSIPMDAALMSIPEFLANEDVDCSNCPKVLSRLLGFEEKNNV